MDLCQITGLIFNETNQLWTWMNKDEHRIVQKKTAYPPEKQQYSMWYLKVIFHDIPRIHLTFSPLKKSPQISQVFRCFFDGTSGHNCANSPLSCHPFNCENQRSPRQSGKAAGFVPFIGTSTGCPFRSMQTKIQTLQVGPRNMVDDLMGLHNRITTSLQIHCEDILCEILGPCTTLDQQLKQALVVTVVGGTSEHASWRPLTSHSCSCFCWGISDGLP